MDDLQSRLQSTLPRRYALDRVIGRGGMATVFLAEESHPKRQVAIKVFSPDVAARLGPERFLREVDFASSLTHPHIVPIYAAGDADGLLYYVMPFVEGETLRDRLVRQPGGLPIGEALSIAHDVAEALSSAHEHGIVHRDIKPENILLHRGHAMVADFGIARAIEVAGQAESTRPTRFTEAGATLGTPTYMSPEQGAADGTIDGRADVYSLGCVLYEMLVGDPPYRGHTSHAIMARHLVDPVPSVRSERPGVPAEVDRVVGRALEKDPLRRFPSAHDFSTALARASGTPTPGGEVSALAGAGGTRWWRHKGFAAVVIAAGILAWPLLHVVPEPGAGGPASLYADSVAVMPCDNLTGDGGYDHLALGITDEVITHLSQVPSLKVSGRHSVSVAKAAGLPISELSRSLGVGYVLECAIRVSGERLRLTAQLMDRTGRGVIARPYETNLFTGFDAHDSLAQALTDDVTAELGAARAVETIRSHRDHGPGHASYLAGTSALARRTPEGLRRAIDQLHQAIALDSAYAAAHAALSQAYALAITYRYDVDVDGYTMAGHALAFADHAIALDSALAEGWAARGYIRAIALAPPGDAARDFERARQLQPNAPNVPSWMSRVYAERGEDARAFSEARRAAALDPRHAGRRIAVAYLALHLHRYELAIEEARLARELEPELMLPRAIEGRALLLSGDAEGCLDVPLGPHSVIRAMCLAELGRRESAEAIVEAAERALENGGGAPPDDFTDVLVAEDLACYYAQRGDAQAALDWLSRAFAESPTGVEVRVYESSLFDPVREDPMFTRVAEQIRAGIWGQVVEASR